MTALDVFVLLLLGGGALIGFVRGFVQEALALAAWVAGLVALKLFHADLAVWLSHRASPGGASLLAFALLFLPVYVAVRLLARAAGRTARRSVLGPVDRVLGGGFGILKGLIGATLFFLLANFATDIVYGGDADRPDWMRSSRTYPLLNATGRATVNWIEMRRLANRKTA